MTPFGVRLRKLRTRKGVTLVEMAGALDVSPAYISALEHGKPGRPTPPRLHQICAYFEIIWDEADNLRRLADLSLPKITIDTSGLLPKATELANRLAEEIGELDDEHLSVLLASLKR